MKMQKGIRGILDHVLVWVNIGLFAFMVVVGTYQILVRYLFNRPSTVSEELLTYAFAWMSLLAATYVFGKRGHMRMGFLADKMAGNGRLVMEMVIEGLVFAFAAVVMVYGGSRITSLTMSQKTASLGVPMGVVYGIVPVCGGVVMIYNVLNVLQMWYDGNVISETVVEEIEEASGKSVDEAGSGRLREEDKEAGSGRLREEDKEAGSGRLREEDKGAGSRRLRKEDSALKCSVIGDEAGKEGRGR